MPPITRAAFRIYLAALLLSLVIGSRDRPDPLLPLDALPLGETGVLLLFLPLCALFVLIIFKARSGRNWARWALGAIVVFSVVPYAEHIMASFASSPALGLVNSIPLLGQLLAVALLFTRPSNAWYAQRQ